MRQGPRIRGARGTFFLALPLLTALGIACAHPAPARQDPVAESSGSSGASPRTLGWIAGQWERAEGVEHWHEAGGVLWGVGFTVKGGKTAFFEVLLIEAADGRLRYVAMPGGKTEVMFPAVEIGADAVTFANPQHDFPKTIHYRREGDELAARVAGDGSGEDYRWRRASQGRAEPLEAADRAFAADSASRGLPAWVSAFDSGGAMWSRRRKVALTGDAIRETMAPLFEKKVQIEWAPVASGLSPAGDLGYTVGTSRYTGPGPDGARVETHRGAYVSIWRRQADGSWKVLFDTGN